MKLVNVFGLTILAIYVVVLWYMLLKLYKTDTRPFASINDDDDGNAKPAVIAQPQDHIVEIWSKAAIGNYLWEHIFNANLVEQLEGLWSYGEVSVNQITFRFRTGASVIPSKVPQDIENVVVILNGREKPKVEYSQMWLNYLPAMGNVKNVALVILGDEECRNSWLTPYLLGHGGYLRAVFLVYDSIFIDDQFFFQWPLGVATYRGFPSPSLPEIRINTARPFRCNFLGTVYPNSSREVLLKVITDNNFQNECFLKPRYKWLAQETENSREVYTQVLLNSDLTLNPVGKNSECYRIYEAMSYGSVPVIEDLMTAGDCGRKTQYDPAPLRLLKQYKAPVIYIHNWEKQLPKLLEKERLMSQKDIIQRRRNIVKWYLRFKEKMKESFVNVINKKFFLDNG